LKPEFARFREAIILEEDFLGWKTQMMKVSWRGRLTAYIYE
jgi:hypothetical protein